MSDHAMIGALFTGAIGLGVLLVVDLWAHLALIGHLRHKVRRPPAPSRPADGTRRLEDRG